MPACTLLLSSTNYSDGESLRLVTVECPTAAEDSDAVTRSETECVTVRSLASLDTPANTSFLALCPGGFFAVTESDDSAAVHRFSLRGNTISLLETLPLTAGRGLCHISYSPKNRLLLCACYESGHIAAVHCPPEGPMREIYMERLTDGDKLTRAHCFLSDPSGRFAFAVNIALDRIDAFMLEPGKIIPLPHNSLSLPAGTGPRHLLFHPTQPLCYCVTEYSNELLVLSLDSRCGALSLKETHSTLSPSFTGESFGSGLCISADTKFLYAGNRGENTVARFTLSPTGEPIGQENFSCGGDWPRHIALAAGGTLLCVCNQRSDSISLLSRDAATGEIQGEAARIPMKNPCFVMPVDGIR